MLCQNLACAYDVDVCTMDVCVHVCVCVRMCMHTRLLTKSVKWKSVNENEFRTMAAILARGSEIERWCMCVCVHVCVSVVEELIIHERKNEANA